MNSFPLYSVLSENIPKKDLTIPEKTDFMKKIIELDVDGYELIYALIKYYYIQDKGNAMSIPYKGTVLKNAVKFNLLDFPSQLKQILYKFILMHRKKIEEDKEKERL
jgi:hypothetical protein